MNQEEFQAQELKLQRLREEEIQMRQQMQRQQEEHQARLEMQKRLQEEEQQLRARMNFQAPPVAPQPVVINNVINNNVQTARPTLGLVVRLLYFFFIGWWFGFAWLFGATLMCISFFGLPIGILMFAKTSQAFFLW
jgi:hypothetical protein